MTRDFLSDDNAPVLLSEDAGLWEIEGVVDSVVYTNPDNGYHVLEVLCGSQSITAVGELPAIFEGERIKATGRFKNHRSFGKQFSIETLERWLPDNRDDILKYLISGAVKGIGPVTAERIFDRFGDQTMAVLENDPMLLQEVRGISAAKAREFANELTRVFDLRRMTLFLAEYGLHPSESIRTVKVLGDATSVLVQENPYILCSTGIGLDFARVDELAREKGFEYDNHNRIKSGVIHVLRHNLSNGHTCLPDDKLLAAAAAVLRCEPEMAENALDSLTEEGYVVAAQTDSRKFCFLSEYYSYESFIAQKVLLMSSLPPKFREVSDAEIDALQKQENIVYEKHQREAIAAILKHRINIITGGPGTGKTTILSAVLRLAHDRGMKISLAAPTGRAAKRMSELTGWEAMTIHRLLECGYNEDGVLGFTKNEDNTLSADLTVIDEASMCDAEITAALLHAVVDDSYVVFVGDSDQLPSIGAGNIMRDLCDSGKVSLIRLTEIYRQAADSKIVVNAHRINRGEAPDLSREGSDFFLIKAGSERECSSLVTDLCCRRLPAKYGWSPFTDIQVLSPSRKGMLGTFELNKRLQQVLNPPGAAPSLDFEGFSYRIGDKIMQTRNNYDIIWEKDGLGGIGLFNGDCGIITGIDRADWVVSADFDGREVVLTYEQMTDIEPAYACTVHKSQGNEYEAVIIPVFDAYSDRLMYRNLLYTAVTRARQLLVLVGSENVLMKMVSNDRRSLRYTGLRRFLNDGWL